jgi:predicted lipid carrier protein YhbT
MHASSAISAIPAPVGALIRPLPLWPLRFVLERLAASLATRRPNLFARLGLHADKVFLVEPVDLPVAFRLTPCPVRPAIEPVRRPAGRWDARIAGPLAALVGLVHGAFDGDALFFSRDIVVEGDTEAVLALRNALDDAEIDLLAEIATAFRPAGPVLEPYARRLAPAVACLTGLQLARAERVAR